MNIYDPCELTIIEQPKVRSPSPAPAAPTVSSGAGSSPKAPSSQRWTDEEERLLKALRLKNSTESLKHQEWQVIADTLRTGRTACAVMQHWQVLPLSALWQCSSHTTCKCRCLQ